MILNDTLSILKKRAQKLAQETEVVALEDCLHVVTFLLAHETYALEQSYIQEVFPLRQLTPLPCTPSFLLGIISVRGRIVSVVNLKEFFNLPLKGLSDLDKVLILSNG